MSIEITTYCIQPILIDTIALSKLFSAKLNMSVLTKYTIDDKLKTPPWKSNMDSFSNLYSSFIVLDYQRYMEYINFDNLKLELQEQNFNINKQFNISIFIKENTLKAFLMFDYRLLQFVIIFEINFKINQSDVTNLLVYHDDNLDFYNATRNIFVKENDGAYQIKSICNLKNKILNFVHKIINESFTTNLDFSDFSIPNNSGNITNVVVMQKNDKQKYIEATNLFLRLNQMAERNQDRSTPIELNSLQNSNFKDVYYFSGRFHTIILSNPKDKLRYIPIQFQMQFLWFYLSKQINLILEYYNDTISQDNSIEILQDYSDKLDVIINKISNLNIFNQKFKLAIETDSKIYNKIQGKWNIENMIQSSNEYIVFFKDYLSRLYNKKSSKLGQRQNTILLSISLIQFIALISVWTDYLSIVGIEAQQKATLILPFFGSYKELGLFNLYLPLILLFVILLMFVYIFKDRFKPKGRRR